MNLLRVDNSTYQEPSSILHMMSSLISIFPLFVWHKHLGHTNFFSLKTFLHRLNFFFSNDSNGYICNSYQQAKATKVYNQKSQKYAQKLYQLIYTDLISLIKPIGFSRECYFFTFIDDYTRITKTYSGSRKNDWLKYLKTYYSFCKMRSKEEHPIKCLQSDYGSKLQSHNVNN